MRKYNDGRCVRRTPNWLHLAGGIWRVGVLPGWVRRLQRRLCLHGWERRADAAEIRRRVEFYCPGAGAGMPLHSDDPYHHMATTGHYRRKARAGGKRPGSAYYYDLGRWLKGFPHRLQLAYYSGDNFSNPSCPTIVKTRRLDRGVEMGTIVNMDSRRHFARKVCDPVGWADKEPVLFFRGAITGKPARVAFFEQWAGKPGFDLGDTAADSDGRWHRERVSPEGQFAYRYILCLEGADVASSLHWVMASGCVPVMPRPTVEGWLMHSQLVPGVHYIEIAPDFSDVGQVMAWHFAHPEEGERIAEASRQWAARFADPRREAIISYLTVQRYLETVNGK